MIARVRRMVAALWRDRAGIALVEFAIVAPVLLTLFLGGYQLLDAIACNRKVTVTARSVADLLSRYGDVNQADVNNILNASTQILAPYSATAALVRVSTLEVNAAGTQGKVTWSSAINGAELTTGSNVTLPANMATPTSTLVMSEVIYTYSPTIGAGFVRPQTLKQAIFMVPRVSTTIPCPDCG